MRDALNNIPPTAELFAAHRITHVAINYYPDRSFNPKCHGVIAFSHGSYGSDRKFSGDDFDDVIGQMRTFLENLNKESGAINGKIT